MKDLECVSYCSKLKSMFLNVDLKINIPINIVKYIIENYKTISSSNDENKEFVEKINSMTNNKKYILEKIELKKLNTYYLYTYWKPSKNSHYYFVIVFIPTDKNPIKSRTGYIEW